MKDNKGDVRGIADYFSAVIFFHLYYVPLEIVLVTSWLEEVRRPNDEDQWSPDPFWPVHIMYYTECGRLRLL